MPELSEPHFTYTTLDKNSLYQGDVLRRTEALNKLLETIHPHFFNHQFNSHFSVITQSCDLVRRNGKECSVRYITLAAVRPITLAINREIESICTNAVAKKLRILQTKRKDRVKQFVEHLLNNNESDYFYLRESPLEGLVGDHCVFLRLTIPVKSEFHYDTLLGAKILQLNDSFQHKLGYLIGNSYSRIGTQDWEQDAQYSELVDKYVDLANFFDDKIYDKLVKRLKNMPEPDQTLEKATEIAEEMKAEKERQKNETIAAMSEVLMETGLDDAQAKKASMRLINSPKTAQAFKWS